VNKIRRKGRMARPEKVPEQELDDIIDALNMGRKPGRDTPVSEETEKLLPALAAVRHLAEPPPLRHLEEPSPSPRHLGEPAPPPRYLAESPRSPREESPGKIHGTKGSFPASEQADSDARWHAFRPSLKRLATLSIAAAILAVIGLSLMPRIMGQDVVLAMSRAVEKVTNYHGLMEVRARNAAGDEWMVRRLEIWVDGDKYAVKQDDGTTTVNNLERKWQIRPEEAVVAIFPVAPDLNMRGIDLRDEARRALEYPHSVVAEETVAGRVAHRVEISPPGGRPYYLWLDKETNLPVQLKTAMINALETVYTFTSLNVNGTVDPSLYEYRVPDGFSVLEENPGMAVVSIEEAKTVSGVDIVATGETPRTILAFPAKVVLVYPDCEVIQEPAVGEFEMASYASKGTAAGGPVEVLQDSYRWRQEGLEIRVQGPRRLELAVQLAPDFELPSAGADLVSRAQVKVQVDLEIAARNQEQVDGGHMPWQVDPSMVAMQFVNLETGGVEQGEYGEFTVTDNTGAQAIVEVEFGSIKTVYLQRLVRQDESGVWSVVGYDPR
jgi:outer membrane lipoprotein-sorting protein